MALRMLALAIICSLTAGCAPRATSPASGAATAAGAKAFLDTANETALRLGIQQSQASWVQQTFITDDTEAIAARANQAANESGVRFAKEATRFDHVEVPADERRGGGSSKRRLLSLARP